MHRTLTSCLAALAALGFSGIAAPLAPKQYILLLSDPPLARHIAAHESRDQMQTARASLEAAQVRLRTELQGRGIPVVASMKTVINAVIVRATPDRITELRQLAGVTGVIPVRHYKLQLNTALPMLQVPQAWNVIGGQASAGAGIKIAILDTGVDNTHPAFQDAALTVPSGFPTCLNSLTTEVATGYDCSAFTNNKVIVAKSFIQYLNDSNSDDSTPQDYSPRDRFGHGTATAMCAAGETNTGSLGNGSADITITGVAPKAWIGNYRVLDAFGGGSDASILTGLDEALNDGMNVASMSFGAPAFNSVSDSGNQCFFGPSGKGVPCDVESYAVDLAVQAGMIVVVAAGNAGANGNVTPTLGTVATPAIAPSAITVGGVENQHTFGSALVVSGHADITDTAGNGPVPSGPVTAPLVDAGKLANDTYGCSGFPTNSLKGDFALIGRGPTSAPCTFAAKVQNAQTAGARGVVFYDDVNEPVGSIAPGGLTNTSIPSVIISQTDGLSLKSYVDSTAGVTATINPAVLEVPNSKAGQMYPISSRGPSIGTGALKPDVLGVSDPVFMATQSYDPNGGMYSASRYVVASGTSFSTPMVAGAAALVLQQNPTFGPDAVKSSIMNTANATVTDSTGAPAAIVSTGAGLLNAGAAVSNAITIDPPSVSFGTLWPAATQTLNITNNGGSAATLQLTIQNNMTSAGNTVSLSQPSLTLAPGASGTVSVSISGSQPAPGLYSGAIEIAGASVPLHVPFLFGTPSGTPYNLVGLIGDGFDGTEGQFAPCCVVQVLDQYGIGVNNATVTWTVNQGDAQLTDDSGNPIGTSQTTTTGAYGLAYANLLLGTATGDVVTANIGSLSATFGGSARPVPNVTQYASTYNRSSVIAPGSWMILNGTGLSDVTQSASGVPLPQSIASAAVSFDLLNTACAPYEYSDPTLSGRCSFTGYLTGVSPGAVNVFVPWELEQGIQNLIARGFTPGCNKPKGICVEVKDYIDATFGNVIQVPMGLYSPGFFNNAGFVGAMDANTGASINAGHGATPGESVTLWCNGLGPVETTPASGTAAPANDNTTAQPTVTIGGKPVSTISFSGLAPGYVGIYWVTVEIPQGVPAGKQPVTLSIGGMSAPTSYIQIQ